ncbi:hypothetical protein ART_2860 [Arthrobacter sp. PAMC 25486]|nr:hypothetical protein ART_2860 [Arthrobacter sp. PAMC 25486]
MMLAISDAHSGLKKAIATGFQGAGWQRCRVHFMPDVLAVHPKDPRTWSARSSAPPSPNPTLQPCLLRLAGAVIVEQHYGWQARDRLLRREGPLHEAGPAVLAAARAFIAAD